MFDFAKKVKNANAGNMHLFSVGQAGFILKSTNGQLLGIDLYLSECVEKIEGHIGFKRLLPKILETNELQFDYVIATHFHRDHFDIDSMYDLVIKGNSKLFAAIDCERDINNLGIQKRNVVLVAPGNTFNCGDFTLNFINCDHGLGAPRAVGVIIEVDGFRILVTGDTCLRLDRIEEYQSKGKINILIAPINGANGNLSELDCVTLSEEIKPKLTIPCHYGMFASHGGDPGLFINLMREKNLPFLIMSMGEQYTLQR